jgi:hypothetical protein
MKKFTGMYDEVVMWNDLKVLAEEKYNFSRVLSVKIIYLQSFYKNSFYMKKGKKKY